MLAENVVPAHIQAAQQGMKVDWKEVAIECHNLFCQEKAQKMAEDAGKEEAAKLEAAKAEEAVKLEVQEVPGEVH